MTDSSIKDDVYMEIDDEFEQIRTALGMYISKLGTEGAEHLIKELTNNEFDECVNPLALSTEFNIVFDEVEQSFSTEDFSRGIPFDKLIDVCTKKHTSTKFIREGEKMKEQCGRNGVGLVVTAACSSYFSMESYRGNESKLIEIVDGEIREHEPKKLKKEKHGLCTKFIPSPEYLKGDVNLEGYRVQDYLRRMSYIMRDDIKIHYYEYSKDMKDYEKGTPSFTANYTRKGLSEDVKYLSSNLEFNPVEIVAITDDFDLELAFSYDKTLDETIVDGYCNYVNTTEGGNHEIVAQRAICDFFSREAKKLDANSKFEVTFEDCKKGLIFCVNCKHVDPAYEGQHKSRVSNTDVLKNGKRLLMDQLYRYFNANSGLLRRIISYLRMIAKVRIESHKIKGTTMKKQTTFLDDNEISMFYPLADRNYNGYSEIIIAEGDSSAIAIDTARNSKYQAVFGVMGVVDNVYGLSPMTIYQKSKTFRNLINILGCDIGPKFDITKLKYDKIILESDADADGNNITSLELLFFIVALPELIIQGKVYKSLPPLFVLNEKSVRKWYKGNLYLYNKSDYYAVINKIIAENVEVALKTDQDVVNPLKKKELLRWLDLNKEYTSELKNLKSRAYCNMDVIEYVCYANIVSGDSLGIFKDMIEERFEELIFDVREKSISGSYRGENVSLIVDDIFWKFSKKFCGIVRQNLEIGDLIIYVKNKNEEHDRFDEFTIGQFLLSMENTYTIKIDQRYKGIGEMDADIIFATTLNPKMRKLVRFTVDDMTKTLETFRLLHAKTPQARKERRDLLDNSPITYMDLDN